MRVEAETIIESLGDNVYVVTCSYCRGRGLAPYKMKGWEIETYHNDLACPICKGKGILKLKADDRIVPDSRCSGTGHEPYNPRQAYHDRVCTTCQGTGMRSLTGGVRILE